MRIAAATSVEKKAAMSAFWADCASLRRPSRAAATPATSAYVARPSVTRSAARPSSGIRLASGAASLRRVLRGALRDHRARRGDECSVPKPPVDDDVSSHLEQVGNRARVANRDRRRVRSADVTQSEAQAARVRIARDRSYNKPRELD